MNEPAIAPLATENRLARATRKMAKASEITAAPRMENSIPRLASNTGCHHRSRGRADKIPAIQARNATPDGTFGKS